MEVINQIVIAEIKEFQKENEKCSTLLGEIKQLNELKIKFNEGIIELYELYQSFGKVNFSSIPDNVSLIKNRGET